MLKFKLTISEGADYYPSNFYFDAETVGKGVQKMKDFLIEKQLDPSDNTDWRFATTEVTIIKEGVGSFTYNDINSSLLCKC